MEADDVMVLDKPFVSRFIALRQPAVPGQQTTTLVSQTGMSARSLGHNFGLKLLTTETTAAVLSVRQGRPRIPSELDRRLLDEVRASLGTTHLDDDPRLEARQGFWEAIASDSPPPVP
jgi:hypothetical protein